MDSHTNSGVPIKIITIVSFSIGFCCLFLCCVSYILLKNKNKKKSQIHCTNHNHRHSSVAHADIFTIEMPDAQSSNTAIMNQSYLNLSDKSLLTNESIQPTLPTQHESNVQSSQLPTIENVKQTS